MFCTGARRSQRTRFEQLDFALLYDLIAVDCQILQDRLCDMDALIRRDPFLVQVRAAVALGVLDESRMDRIGDENFDRLV